MKQRKEYYRMLEYEREKKKLQAMNLTPQQYEYEIRLLCRRLKI